jgi:HSP20 family protein
MKYSLPIVAALAAPLAMGYSFSGIPRFVRPVVVGTGRPFCGVQNQAARALMREELLANREQMREELMSNGAQMREAFLANRAQMREDLFTNLINNHNNRGGGANKNTLSPRYQITDNAKKFEISMDVPGVNLEDISIDIDDSNDMLRISGQRQQQSSTSSYSSSFSKSFSLGHTIDKDKVTASLANGVLIVSAPKNLNKVPETVRKIPINIPGGTTTIRTTAVGEDHAATEQAVPINNKAMAESAEEVGQNSHAEPSKDEHDVDISTQAPHAGRTVNESNKQHADDTQIENPEKL